MSFILSTYQSFESFLFHIGLGNPIARAAFGAVIFSAPIIMHFPISYYPVQIGADTGNENSLFYMPRPWSVTDKGAENGTLFPWFIWPILGALLFGLVL